MITLKLRHYGPGPHKNGSPQSVHGRWGQMSKPAVYADIVELRRAMQDVAARERVKKTKAEAQANVVTAQMDATGVKLAEAHAARDFGAIEKYEREYTLAGAKLQKLLKIRDATHEKQLVLAKKYIQMHTERGLSASVLEHGMSTAQTMIPVEYGHLRLFYDPKDRSSLAALAASVRVLTLDAPNIPFGLARHTRGVFFTKQENKDNGYWRAAYNLPNLRANATGGNGNIVVYGSGVIGPGTLAHEMGHNMARGRLGESQVPEDTRYARIIQSKEPPVSDYAKASRAEDFAEATKMFVLEPEKLKRIAPQRYGELSRLIGARGYSGR